MISVRDLERLKVDIVLGIPKDELRVNINTPELEEVYRSLKKEIDDALAKGLAIDFSADSTEAPDFEVVKKVE